MATLASPASPPSTPLKRRTRSWARRVERYCCVAATYFPLAFVYSLSTWAVYVAVSVGSLSRHGRWIGLPSNIAATFLYILAEVSYTVAVFTDPGSPLSARTRGNNRHGYSHLPTTELPEFVSYTVSSSGGSRFCKKCQCVKPDRTHHCSTCKKCVLKMDHHCPWLATCVGLHNYKAFLLFLIYISAFCWVAFSVSGYWVWNEMFSDTRYMDTYLPVNVILLAILSGIIGLVLTGFTAWHISLAVRGLTTIESLEKTRYASPLRKTFEVQRARLGPPAGQEDEGFSHRLQEYGQQIVQTHANSIPGVTRAEEGEERPSPAVDSFGFERPQPPDYYGDQAAGQTPAQRALHRNYNDLEREREREQYEEYLDSRDSEKMPNAWDLGWRRNLLHLFGEKPLYWALPVCNTTGDGWHWEASRKFLEAREEIRQKREQEQAQQEEHYRDLYERALSTNSRSYSQSNQRWSPTSKTLTGGDTSRPTTGVSMKTLAPMSPRPRPGDSDFEDGLDSPPYGTSSEGSIKKIRYAPREAGRPPPRVRKGTGSVFGTSVASRNSERKPSDEWRNWE
ncbi:hypothetical protein DTO212C5_5038 [Paecilomyces variotii]|nr:hypothetical protein DTO212C5_5038 [Paecilomyces variotii]